VNKMYRKYLSAFVGYLYILVYIGDVFHVRAMSNYDMVQRKRYVLLKRQKSVTPLFGLN